MSTDISKSAEKYAAAILASVNKAMMEVINEEASVIHPDYRDDAIFTIRWLAGENVLQPAIDSVDLDELNRTIAKINGTLARMGNTEIGTRTRWHMLNIATQAAYTRKTALDRARDGNVPRPVYINDEPKPSATSRPRPTLRRVV